jgi:hypothetical protein
LPFTYCHFVQSTRAFSLLPRCAMHHCSERSGRVRRRSAASQLRHHAACSPIRWPTYRAYWPWFGARRGRRVYPHCGYTQDQPDMQFVHIRSENGSESVKKYIITNDTLPETQQPCGFQRGGGRIDGPLLQRGAVAAHPWRLICRLLNY